MARAMFWIAAKSMRRVPLPPTPTAAEDRGSECEGAWPGRGASRRLPVCTPPSVPPTCSCPLNAWPPLSLSFIVPAPPRSSPPPPPGPPPPPPSPSAPSPPPPAPCCLLWCFAALFAAALSRKARSGSRADAMRSRSSPEVAARTPARIKLASRSWAHEARPVGSLTRHTRTNWLKSSVHDAGSDSVGGGLVGIRKMAVSGERLECGG